MHHPQLGQLEMEGKSLCGNVLFNDCKIPLRVDPDDVPVAQALSLATAIASSLFEYDQLSKDVIVRDLLENYNSGWNEYDEVQDDGSLKSVTNPQLNSQQFKEQVKLTSITITGDSCVELWYDDGGLFWGHSIFVQSLNGADATSFEAQLFG